MTALRKFIEATWEQGVDEAIAYSVTTTPWGGGSSSPSMIVKENGQDVTTDVSSGSASGNGDTITLPVISGLTAGKKYRLEVKWTNSGGQVVEAYGIIVAKE